MFLDYATAPLRNNTLSSAGNSAPSHPDRRRQNNNLFADQSTVAQRPDLNRDPVPPNTIQNQQYTDAYRLERSSLGSNTNPYPSQEPEKSIGHPKPNRIPSGSQFVPFVSFDPPPPSVEQRSSAQEQPSSGLHPDFKDRWGPLSSVSLMQSVPNSSGYGQSAGARRDERHSIPPGMSNGRRGGHAPSRTSKELNQRSSFSKRVSFL